MKKFNLPNGDDYLWYDETTTTETEVSSFVEQVLSSIPSLVIEGIEGLEVVSSGNFKYFLQKSVLDRNFTVPTVKVMTVVIPENEKQVNFLKNATSLAGDVNLTFAIGAPTLIPGNKFSTLKEVAVTYGIKVKEFADYGDGLITVDLSEYLYSKRELDQLENSIKSLNYAISSLDTSRMGALLDKVSSTLEVCRSWKDECVMNATSVASTLADVEKAVGVVNSKADEVLSVDHDYRRWSDTLSSLIQSILSLKGSLVYSYQQFVSEALSATNLKNDLLNGVTNNLEQIEDLVKQFDKFTEFNQAINDLIVQLKSNIAEAELVLSYAPTQAEILSLLKARHTIKDVKDISEAAVNIKSLLKKEDADIFS